MTYQELFQAVDSGLQRGIAYTVQVRTWRYGSNRVETQWQIYVEWTKDNGRFYDGQTPEEALSRFRSDVSHEQQTLEQTSAAVGSAEVS